MIEAYKRFWKGLCDFGGDVQHVQIIGLLF